MSDFECKPTERKFANFNFRDSNDRACSLQKSSLATVDQIWFGTDQEGARMHLSRQDVKRLLPLLRFFVETGELPTLEQILDIGEWKTKKQKEQGGKGK